MSLCVDSPSRVRVPTPEHHPQHPFAASLRTWMAEHSSKQPDPALHRTELPSCIPSTLAVEPPPAPSAQAAQSPQTPNTFKSLARAGKEGFPNPAASPRPTKRARFDPPPMTAAAALADRHRTEREKQRASQSSPSMTSANPAKEVLSALMGIASSQASKTSPATSSSPGTTRAANTMSAPLAAVAENIRPTPSEDVPTDPSTQASPTSVSSVAAVKSAVLLQEPVGGTVESPASMQDTAQDMDEDKSNADNSSPGEGPKAFSYPGPLLQPHLNDGRRGMSLPHSGSWQGSPRSPTKKHRCPYCATEFTRHHNLKSHLLTHSQEKPYVCSTCQSRFRRLHDLKRHTKLHTGERPHICPKCGRKFARGDALARHNKGPGGCAGRRSSMGSFGGDDDFDGGNDDSMDGVVYGEPENMDDDDEGLDKRPNMPSIRHPDASGDNPPPSSAEQGSNQSRQPSTYPPIQGRPPGGYAGGLYPPRTSQGGSNTTSAPPGAHSGGMHFPSGSSMSVGLHPPGPGSAVFPSNSITESPKPLSPRSGHVRQPSHDGTMYRKRSPSLNTPFQPQHFSRGGGRRTPPPGPMGVPPPGGPQLPPPHGLNPPDPRFTVPTQASPAHPPTQPSGPPTHMTGGGALSSQSNSLSSHGHSAQGSGENAAALFGQSNDRLWAYVKSLEFRINGLQDEVNSLRGQLAAVTQPPGR